MKQLSLLERISRLEEKLVKESIGYDAICDDLYERLKSKDNWEQLAKKELRRLNLTKFEVSAAMNMLHGEEYFDDGYIESFGESSEEEEYEEEELERIDLEVSTRYAQKAQDAFRDVKFELKAKGRIDIDQRRSNTWEISFSEDWEREEVIDELEDIFQRYGVKEYDFS